MNNTQHHPAAGTFHESVRAAVSDNTDTRTGERLQVLSSTRLLMRWEAGELRMCFTGTRQVLEPQRAAGAAA